MKSELEALRRLMSKRIEVECGDEEGDTEEERVCGRSSEHVECEEGQSRARRGGRRRKEEAAGKWKPPSSNLVRNAHGRQRKIMRRRMNSERKGVKVRSSLMRSPGDASGGRK